MYSASGKNKYTIFQIKQKKTLSRTFWDFRLTGIFQQAVFVPFSANKLINAQGQTGKCQPDEKQQSRNGFRKFTARADICRLNKYEDDNQNCQANSQKSVFNHDSLHQRTYCYTKQNAYHQHQDNFID